LSHKGEGKHERTLSLKRKAFHRKEILIDIGFLEDMEKELEELNKGKRGRPYKYSDGLFIFLGYLYALV